MSSTPSQSGTKESYNKRCLALVMTSLGDVAEYLNDPDVNELQINSPEVIFVKKGVERIRVQAKLTRSDITTVTQVIAAMNDKVIGTRFAVTQEEKEKFILSGRLPGLRIEAVMEPVAINGPSMCIRKHASIIKQLREYVDDMTMPEDMYEVLLKILASKQSVLVSGATYSGKTTLVSAMINVMSNADRFFVIEQVHELLIKKEDCVIVECDPTQGVTAEIALRTAMRYSPSRIIVGELRGAEAVNFLEACNTGHTCMSTIHANDARDSLMRVEDLMTQAGRNMDLDAIQRRIGHSIGWVMHIGITNGKRRINELYRVDGYDSASKGYKFTNYVDVDKESII